MIDVSSYQGTIDWPDVHAAGVRQAAIKATEGVALVDEQLHANVAGARAAGIDVMLYHYAHPANSPRHEAFHFLTAAKGLVLPGDLPPALDLEVAEGHDWTYLNGWKAQWLAAVDDAIGLRHGTVFYSYYYFLQQMQIYNDRPIWGAALGQIPTTTAKRWSIWQHSFTGSITGITGTVDLDVVLKPLPRVAAAV